MAAFTGIAAVYDLVKSHRDYAGEAQAVRDLIAAQAPNAQSLLEVACGTGTLLTHLSEFQRTGSDASPQMLAVASRKLGPAVPLIEAEMETLQIPQAAFDVVLCMDGAIGYVKPADLTATLSRLAGHLNDRGLLILEPWHSPDQWAPGRVHVTHHQDDTTTVVRVAYGHNDGNIDFHTTIGTAAGLRTLDERYDFALHTEDDLAAALRAAGLTPVRVEATAVFRRGLWIAQRS